MLKLKHNFSRKENLVFQDGKQLMHLPKKANRNLTYDMNLGYNNSIWHETDGTRNKFELTGFVPSMPKSVRWSVVINRASQATL
jgi:hypothetical protein